MQIFDPTGISHLMPGQQPSQAQRRYMAMWELVNNEFKGEDQYVMMTPPNNGPQAVKCLTAEHAAQAIYDKEGRLATEEEVEKYKTENSLQHKKIQVQLDRQDLAKAVGRIVKD